MKARVHEGHLGIERCKTRERECLFRPGMTSKIADMVSRCETCIQSRRKQQREPFIPLPPATHARSRVACDLFHMNRRDFLLIADYFTRYQEVTLLTETTCKLSNNCTYQVNFCKTWSTRYCHHR